MGNGKNQKTLLIWRIGGIGDLLWCTAALPVLRRGGWLIDFCTDGRGMAVLRNNPHVRSLIDFDAERDPGGKPLRDPENEQLLNAAAVSRWWAEIAKGYGRAIPLTWSVEGVALWRVGDNPAEYHLPLAERQSDMNYTDEIVRRLCMPWLGGLLPQLWTSKPERRWLEALRARHVAKKQQILLWHICGSTYHKILPQALEYIGGFLEQFPGLVIYLLGDDRLAAFEERLPTLPESSRARCISVRGQWDLRMQILAPSVADCVVGPESAVTNAAACWDVPKVIFFSHSRHENLSLYWWNAYPIYPTGQCECAPCYRIIEGEPEFCRVYEADLGWEPIIDQRPLTTDDGSSSIVHGPGRGRPVGAKCCVYQDHGLVFRTIGSILQGRQDRTCPACRAKRNRILDPGVYICECGARFGLPLAPQRLPVVPAAMSCPVCGAATYERIAIGWARCGCGVIFQDVRHLDAGVYDENYTQKYDSPECRGKIRAVGERWLPRIEELLDHGPTIDHGQSSMVHRRLLEIGYCWPENLWLARQRGWEIAGCEINKSAVSDFPVLEGDFELLSMNGNGGAFDAVISNHVFEHFKAPIKALEKMRDLVRPGGLILVATPDTTNPNLGGHLHRKEHYIMWSPDALAREAGKLGLEVVEVERHDGPECGFISWFDFHMLLRRPATDDRGPITEGGLLSPVSGQEASPCPS